MPLNAVDSNLGRVSFLRETTWGDKTLALNNMQIARLNSSALAPSKETAVSNELRADRMVSDLAEVGMTTGGDLPFELSLGGTYDDFFESVLCGTYTTPVGFTGSVTVTALGGIIDAIGAFTNANVGQWIYLSGMVEAGNNGWYKIATVASDDQITVEDPNTTLVDEINAAGQINGTMLRNGIVKRSYAMELFFQDALPLGVGVAEMFWGQRLNNLSLNVTSGAIVEGTWSFMGGEMQIQDGEYALSTVNPTTTPVVNATSNVIKISTNGVPFDCRAQGITINLTNNLRNQMAVGSKYPCGIGYGRQVIEGELTVYFQDKTLVEQFLNHDAVSVAFAFADELGNGMHIEIPKIRFADGAPNLEGIDTDVVLAMAYQALVNDLSTHQIQMDIVNVP